MVKIAIRGHESRGKEVIQILESLGGVNYGFHKGNNPDCYYELHYDSIWCVNTKSEHFKYYTLEEFEKEFPFKIGDKVIFPVKMGWMSGKVISLTYVEDKLKYGVNTRFGEYHYVEPHKLGLYPMKEERNITLTLDKAKEWYKKGGELKEVALQAYSEKELNPLPRSWKEFCERYSKEEKEAYIGVMSTVHSYSGTNRNRDEYADKNICPSKKSAEAHLAMIQLEQLRNYWWGDWTPIWDMSYKYCIKRYGGELNIVHNSSMSEFLTFPTKEMTEEFLKCFKDLIEKAGDLI